MRKGALPQPDKSATRDDRHGMTTADILFGAAQFWVWVVASILLGLGGGLWVGPRLRRIRAAGMEAGRPEASFGAERADPRGQAGVFAPVRLRDLGTDFFARLVAETTSDGLVVQRLDGRVIWVNEAYCTMMGRPRAAIVGRNPLEFCMPDVQRPSDAEIEAFRYDPHDKARSRLELVQNQRADGTVFWNQISISFHAVPDGRHLAVLACRDISEQVARQTEVEEARANLEFLAAHDGLTGLPNRTSLLDFALRHSENAHPGDTGLAMTGLAMIRVDLDRFKLTNDTHGHAAGDAVLVEVARRMKEAIRQGDMAARIGGDEFVVACPGVPTLEDLRGLCSALSCALNFQMAYLDRKIEVGASIGGALSDSEAKTADDLLHRSDFALYAAKQGHLGSFAIYDQELHTRFQHEKLMGDALAAAVAENRLEFLYQPVVSLFARQTMGAETIVHWTHPTLGRIPQEDFLPLARRLGIMADIDFAAMQAAIDAKSGLDRAGFDWLRIGFNVSSELISRADFVPRLSAAIGNAALAPEDIVIEVVETALSTGALAAEKEAIDDLRRAGYNVLLDDFGTGHAGLASLSRLDVAGIKTDRDLLRGLDSAPNTRKVMETVVNLCISLERYITIGGVETESQLAVLVELGALVVQGRIFADAMTFDDLVRWMKTSDGPVNNPLIARYGSDATKTRVRTRHPADTLPPPGLRHAG